MPKDLSEKLMDWKDFPFHRSNLRGAPPFNHTPTYEGKSDTNLEKHTSNVKKSVSFHAKLCFASPPFVCVLSHSYKGRSNLPRFGVEVGPWPHIPGLGQTGVNAFPSEVGEEHRPIVES